MIAAVKGQLEYTGLDYVLINVSGVSLRLFVPVSLLEDLGEIGREVKLYTHMYVREDQLALYGFKTNDQVSLFEMLIGVAGVGPKAALSMLSAADVGAIHLAIAQSNVDFLKKVPGIGPKTAARIILELKGKLVDIDKTSRTALKLGDPKQAATALEKQQVVAALSGLGYNPTEIQAALTSLPSDQTLTIEDQVLGALRYLGQ